MKRSGNEDIEGSAESDLYWPISNIKRPVLPMWLESVSRYDSFRLQRKDAKAQRCNEAQHHQDQLLACSPNTSHPSLPTPVGLPLRLCGFAPLR